MNFKLGKGLQSLIPNKGKMNVLSVENKKEQKESIFNIEINKIKPNPNQPRLEIDKESLQELADSIKEHGILQPLIVNKTTKETSRGQDTEYHLIAGHRRLEAAKLLGLPHVPVIIRGSTNQQKLELALVENLQREDLNPMERARAFERLHKEFNLKHHEIAQRVGKSREVVANTIRLLKLPLEIQQALLANKISEGHARALIGIKDKQIQKSLFNEIIKNRLSVRQVEERYRNIMSGAPAKKVVLNSEFEKIAKKLANFLGGRVSVVRSGVGGRVVIYFANEDELNGLIEKILKS